MVDGVVVEHHSGAYGVVAQLHSVAYGAVVPHHSERDGAVAVDWTLDAGVTESPVELDGRALQDSVRGCAEEEQRSLGRGAEQPLPGAFSWEPEPSTKIRKYKMYYSRPRMSYLSVLQIWIFRVGGRNMRAFESTKKDLLIVRPKRSYVLFPHL